VRTLTDPSGAITDSYDYDAFGNLSYRSGTTPNDYLYSGEQFDVNLGFYYLRARYMNPSNGRFWTIDSYEGAHSDPRSLHKFSYANNSPADVVDPSGHIGIGSIIGEVNAVTWRVSLKAYEFPRAIAAGRLLLAALNVASFFGDNESRDLFITVSGGPLGAGLVLSESAEVLFSASKNALSAGFATTHGLTRAAVISEVRANEFIMKKVGLTLDESSSFVASFDGPVSATIAEPGEQWLRYTGATGSKGSFLTRESFGNPQEAVDSLNLRPWGNPASLRQTVTATGRSIILEGRIKGGVPPGVKQTLIVDREKFQFTVGEPY
jgi:RHS repeat-associated protein